MVPRYEEIHETLLALLALRPPSKVLDLGSGTGYTLHRLLEAFPEMRALGLDVSTEMLDRARQRIADFSDRAELRASDIAAPRIEGSFDAIISILAVHHLHADEKRHLFSRIWEHIEPGGVFLLADYFRPAMDRLSELYTLPASPTRTRPSTIIPIRPPSTSRGSWPPASPRSTSSGRPMTSASSSPGARSAEPPAAPSRSAEPAALRSRSAEPAPPAATLYRH